ncbi:4Fe-4S binding protein [bacterium]|nr:4Fe-4S binding protein [bacterium]
MKKLKSLNLIYFSPTRTTQKIIKAVAQGTGLENINEFNLTIPTVTSPLTEMDESHLAIFGSPVYAGRIPPEATSRLSQYKGNKTPAVIIVLYGNREYEDALLELKEIVSNQGFVPIAAGAFIGEHSYSTSEKPIAENRPDHSDLQKALGFGEKIMRKAENLATCEENSLPAIPGNFPYREPRDFSTISPTSIESECTLCLDCVNACPTLAINEQNPAKTDKSLCIVCCACVKVCPSGARVMDHPQIKTVADWLYTNYSVRKEPETFV